MELNIFYCMITVSKLIRNVSVSVRCKYNSTMMVMVNVRIEESDLSVCEGRFFSSIFIKWKRCFYSDGFPVKLFLFVLWYAADEMVLRKKKSFKRRNHTVQENVVEFYRNYSAYAIQNCDLFGFSQFFWL